MTKERKEELLKKRNDLVVDKSYIQKSMDSISILWSPTLTYSKLYLSSEYSPIMIKFINEEIDKIDKELGI